MNGERLPYVRNSRHEAARAARLLTQACGFDVAATGMVVICGANELTVKQTPVDVVVTTRFHLPGWLRKRPRVLSEAEIEAIYEVARRSTTWQPTKPRR